MKKHAEFRAITRAPLNGAPSPRALAESHITPVPLFFVRSHAPRNPAAPDALAPALRVQHQPIDLTRFPRTVVEATLQCAGNRRTGLSAHRAIPNEVAWGNEAIGNAVWEGVSLAAVLERVGAGDGDRRRLHVWFLGGDTGAGKTDESAFGASIPFERALHPGVILADTMNGAPLTPDHGAPLRVVVPGYIGARSVKWLREVRVEGTPSPNHFQAAYSFLPPSSASPLAAEVLGPLRVNSAIAIDDGSALPAGGAVVQGWAMAGGDATIERVELSCDGGRTWRSVDFTSPEKRHVWRLWRATATLARGEHTLVCRAFDSAGATQPATPAEVWNAKGYMNNSWHTVRISVE